MRVSIIIGICTLFVVACGTDENLENNTDVNNTAVDGGEDVGPSDSGANNANNATTVDMGVDMTVEDMGVDMTVEDMGVDMAVEDMGVDMAAEDMGVDMAPDMMMATYDTCDGAVDVTAGGTFTGSTQMQTDDYGPASAANNCPSGGSASGRDVAYSFTPTVDSTYDFVVTPDGNFDPMLYILLDCAIDDVCEDGTVFNGPGEVESLNGFAATAGTTYYLIVDGELVSRGDFTLEVTVTQ